MPGLDGFELIQELADVPHPPLVIFTTGYEQHALRAFQENALAYLLKPVDEGQLAIAVGRAARLLPPGTAREAELERTRRAAAHAAPPNSIVGRKRNNCFLLKPHEILWFSIVDGLVRAQTVDESYVVNHTIQALEAWLDRFVPRPNFFRARRNSLVNLDHVKLIRPDDRSTLVLTMANAHATEIVVSERQSKLLRVRLPGL